LSVIVRDERNLCKFALVHGLQVCQQPRLNYALFTPDGTKFIAINEFNGIHVLDLRLIRHELKPMGLDWDWPEFPPATATRSLEPLKVEINLGEKWMAKSAAESSVKPESKASEKVPGKPEGR
jgi:hypothetical protein